MFKYLIVALTFCLCQGIVVIALTQPLYAQSPLRRVNARYYDHANPFWGLARASLFWFGQVGEEVNGIAEASNYTDVRVGYNQTNLRFRLQSMDRILYSDESPQSNTLTDYDAYTIYLNPDGNTSQLTTNTYRLTFQLSRTQSSEPTSQLAFQSISRWQNNSWTEIATTDIYHYTFWEGNINNGQAAGGWSAEVVIPFSAFGLTQPASQSIWALVVVNHDREDSIGTPIDSQSWPEIINVDAPNTWGQLRFGEVIYSPPEYSTSQTSAIYHQDEYNHQVVDAHVGGGFNCLNQYQGVHPTPNQFYTPFHNYFGNQNYGSTTQINIQNQYNPSDFICFSKYYVTFPLTAIPPDAQIISATLSLNQFGNSGDSIQQYIPEASVVSVHQVNSSWSPDQITWNNAPIPNENISSNLISAIWDCASPNDCSTQSDIPGLVRNWDVGYALNQAHLNQQPLSLALYSPGNGTTQSGSSAGLHTGKYFWASQVATDGNYVWMNRQNQPIDMRLARPRLNITWSNNTPISSYPTSTSTPSPSPTNENYPGDVNNDNQVTLQDYNIIISNFGRRSDNSQPLPRIQGDLDQNGVVDLQDYNQVISHFGTIYQ